MQHVLCGELVHIDKYVKGQTYNISKRRSLAVNYIINVQSLQALQKDKLSALAVESLVLDKRFSFKNATLKGPK